MSNFIDIYMRRLDKYAPIKKKYSRRNHLPIMNKKLSKGILHSRNSAKRFWSNENRKKYTKQRNYCVSLLRRIKNSDHSNLNEKNITDNKMFWKAITPFLSDKVLSTEK